MQFNGARVARGVQLEEVWASADAVLAQGERPTIERVRQHLGRGSPNTVAPMLDAWYASLAKRLTPSSGAAEETPAEGSQSLPPPVLRAAKALWGRALQQAHDEAAERIAVEQSQLHEQRQALELEKHALAQEKQRLLDRSDALNAALHAKDQQIADLLRQLADAQQLAGVAHAESDHWRTKHAHLETTLAAERQRVLSTEEEHRRERGRLEQRAVAQERRLLEEVDRARQEAKRLRQQYDDATVKATKALEAELTRANLLEVQLGSAQAENAGLARELTVARQDLQSTREHLAALSVQATQMLKEARTRLPRDRKPGTTIKAARRSTRKL